VPGLLFNATGTPLIGASAGVFGVLVGGAFLAPNVMVLLFTGEGFPIKHDQAVALHTKPANAERLDFKLKNPPSKYIAFKALHDEDGNNKVTKNWTGIWPKEGLGFSNGRQMGALGPPDFEVAKLAVADIVDSVSLTVTYP